MRILICNDCSLLKEGLSKFHSSRMITPETVPDLCRGDNIIEDIAAIGVLGVNIGWLGAIMALKGDKPVSSTFWHLVANNFNNGVFSAIPTSRDLIRIYAYNAFYKRHKIVANDEIHDITDSLEEHFTVIRRVLTTNNKLLIQEGRALLKMENKLNKDTFVQSTGDVILRVGPQFMNHLYKMPQANANTSSQEEIKRCVISLNTLHKKITISSRDGSVPVIAIVKKIWGDKADGRNNIAGSPYGKEMTIEDLQNAYTTVVDYCNKQQ